MSADGVLPENIWHDLLNLAKNRQMDLDELYNYLRPDAIKLFQRTTRTIDELRALTPKDEAYLNFLRKALIIPDADIAPQLACLQRIRRLLAVQQGNFEPIAIDETLHPDENAYYQAHVIYKSTQKKSSVTSKPEPGELLLTNKFLYFKRAQASCIYIKWQKILKAVQVTADCIALDAVNAPGTGYYTVAIEHDPEMLQAYMEILIKRAKHRLTPGAQTRLQWQLALETPTSQYDSLAERAFLECWQKDNPHTSLTPQYRIQITENKVYKVNFAHLPTRTIIEIAGFADYNRPTQITYDYRRQREIEALGWTIIHFSGQQLREDPFSCARDAKAIIQKKL
jgi:Protein of unknown function (DUF559)